MEFMSSARGVLVSHRQPFRVIKINEVVVTVWSSFTSLVILKKPQNPKSPPTHPAFTLLSTKSFCWVGQNTFPVFSLVLFLNQVNKALHVCQCSRLPTKMEIHARILWHGFTFSALGALITFEHGIFWCWALRMLPQLMERSQ